MKKIIFTLCFAGFVFTSGGQSCTPNQNISAPGVYPNVLPVGVGGQYYHEVVQFNIPRDTNVNLGGNLVNALIDSIKVLDLQGLPKGLTYTCNPMGCALPGGKTSCGLIYGTIDVDETGFYPFIIPIRIYVRIGGSFPFQQADTMYALSMIVDVANGEKTIVQNTLVVYPNPATNSLHIALPFSAHNARLLLYDRQGKKIDLAMDKVYNRIDLSISDLAPGMYYGEVGSEGTVYRFHFIKN